MITLDTRMLGLLGCLLGLATDFNMLFGIHHLTLNYSACLQLAVAATLLCSCESRMAVCDLFISKHISRSYVCSVSPQVRIRPSGSCPVPEILALYLQDFVKNAESQDPSILLSPLVLQNLGTAPPRRGSPSNRNWWANRPDQAKSRRSS